MQELTVSEVNEVNGGLPKLISAFKLGYAIGQGLNWIHERTYMGRGEFPTPPRAGRE